ncbi:MAG: 30S ribosomal protein S2 [Planctomycetota bacterium]
MATLVEDLIEAGIHFGQHRSGWNPKMSPYIYGVRSKIHIIDIRETIKGLLLAKKFISQVVASGKDVCIVGTKRQARPAVEKYADDVSMPYVIERWLGGTLTNFRTIRERLKRLEELEGLVDSGEIDTYSKKMTSQLMREKRKIHRNLSGIRNMNKLPGALFVIDVNREQNALREARTLGIPTVCLVDTDGDPDLVDIPIPGNDDSMRSIDVITREICAAITEGKSGRVAKAEGRDEDGGSGGGGEKRQRRRSQRTQFSASASDTPPPASGDAPGGDRSEAVPTAATGAERSGD